MHPTTDPTHPGDERRIEELETLVRRHRSLVRAAARRVGGRAAAAVADDVEQQVFLETWKQLAAGRRIEHPASYLYRAAARETVRALRRERCQQPRVELTETVALEERPEGSPASRLRARETRDRLRRALAPLTAERRRAVATHLQGYTVAEIMEREAWTYNRARNLIARGMADLRCGLGDCPAPAAG